MYVTLRELPMATGTGLDIDEPDGPTANALRGGRRPSGT